MVGFFSANDDTGWGSGATIWAQEPKGGGGSSSACGESPVSHPVSEFAAMVVGYMRNDHEADGAVFAIYTDADGDQPLRHRGGDGARNVGRRHGLG